VSDSEVLVEIRDLLERVVVLLEPVADNYQDQFAGRQADRRRTLESEIRRRLSTVARRKAWDLADGSRNQAAISRESKLDAGETSRLFKDLRQLGVLDAEAANPTRTIELTEGEAGNG